MPESTKKDDNFRTLGIKALPVYTLQLRPEATLRS